MGGEGEELGKKSYKLGREGELLAANGAEMGKTEIICQQICTEL